MTLPPCVAIFPCADLVDLRLGHDGLAARVRQDWGDALFDGHLLVFLGRCLDRCKLLFWDRGGFILYSRRLQHSRFCCPVLVEQGNAVDLDATALTMLLDGLDLRRVRRPSLWQPKRSPTIDNATPLRSNEGVGPPVDDPACDWRECALAMEAKMAKVSARMEALKRRLFGTKAKKMPPPVPKENARQRVLPASAARRCAERVPKQNSNCLRTRSRCRCRKTNGTAHSAKRVSYAPVGAGTSTVIYDHVAAHFRRQCVRKTLACRCGGYIVMAPAPERAHQLRTWLCCAPDGQLMRDDYSCR